MLCEGSDEDDERVLSRVKVECEASQEFAVRVDIHQGSVLSPIIFAVVMYLVTEEATNEGHALKYADDLGLICNTMEETRRCR